MKSAFEEFLDELAKALLFKQLKPDSKGACLLVLQKEQIPLLFEFDNSLVPNTILVSIEVCPIPHEILRSVLEEGLMANQHLSETLSCKPDSDYLFLHKRLHPKIESADIKKSVDSLIHETQAWRSRVHEILQSPERDDTTPIGLKMQRFKV